MKQAGPDLLCFSHLRWNFVFQRPNHLMSRFAQERRVYFVEEPMFEDGPPRLDARHVEANLTVIVPHLRRRAEPEEALAQQRHLLNSLVREQDIRQPILWLYTPMSLPIAADVEPSLVVYDCMDELSAFRGAPPLLRDRERELFARADLVFTGGQSLYEAKRAHHPSVYAFPSSVDAAHFAKARGQTSEPDDQRGVPRPRLGFFGVIDERLDIDLVARVAKERPDFQLVMLGPVVKIDPATLPRRPNIHWLGQRPYQDLPAYLRGWDVAIMPFALNEATRFISPTKTLEYLAAGKPVVSTAIRDVVTPYGDKKAVHIADASTFTAAVDAALSGPREEHVAIADEMVSATSWDRTWRSMSTLIADTLQSKRPSAARTGGDVPCSTT
ncbi:glycosyltransferase family 1 protein [Sorangium atrum]|uniref:Glycosyltransferase family 1 protein n=1 Tax=Sorangium atrum TaxID=2995308 RepID=A0ABT5BSH4_9BACT|nr:glycosyltransferase family 1 protein [Sorangium aterium]MDC0677113.1 glycosyltransferase family 1 protein [Sorangium aterium]